MRIESLATGPDRAGRYAVRFSDGSVMRLYRQTVEDFGLYVGQEYTDSEYAALKTAAGAMSAKMRAVRIVAATSVSKSDLERRLVHKGEDPKQAQEAVQWMSQLQLVDDRRTAEQIVERCAAKGYGVARAKQALYEKRIPKEYWDDVLENYPDQGEAIADYLRSHLGDSNDPKALQKVLNALIRRGHSYGQIRSALRQFSFDEENIPED
jgi:regulatory protein